MSIVFTRREALAMIAAAPAAIAAQGLHPAQGSQLPLKTSGLEHLGFTVPEPQKSAAFYGRIFQSSDLPGGSVPPLRYYCRLGIGYVAFGGNSTTPARMDHFCATVEDYRLEDMRAELATQGMKLTGTAGFNAVTDPDDIRMQFMATPGGLLPTIIASTRVTQDDAICEAIGLDHVVLQGTGSREVGRFLSQVFRQGDRPTPDSGAHLVHGGAHPAGAGAGRGGPDAAHQSFWDPRGRVRSPGRHPEAGGDRCDGAAVHG